MKLSIIVPVYNMAADGKLQFCMDSLLHQTISDYEIIAVNDASTDDSLNVLRDYERRFPDKVRVITYAENKRQGGAKNEGIKAAVGEWIGFIDSDDWITPDFYEKLITKAEKTGADLVGCDISLVHTHTFEVGEIQRNNDETQVGVWDRETRGRYMLRPGHMVLKVYKGDVIRENNLRFPEGIFYEDNMAAPCWSFYFTHFEKVEEPLYYYYQLDTSTVHTITEARCRDRMKAMELLYEECRKAGFLDEYYKEIEYIFTRLFYVNTLFSYMQGIKKPRLAFVTELLDKTISYFPEFSKNEFYLKEVGAEEQELIRMQRESSGKFFRYYRLKLRIRRIRKKLNI